MITTPDKGRKFTHGCTRFTNETIIKIMEEGVKSGAPVKFIDDKTDRKDKTGGNNGDGSTAGDDQ